MKSLFSNLERKEYLYEAAAKVTLVIGVMSKLLVMEDWDWEDIWPVALRIAIDWDKQIDIKNMDERAYIMEYSQRVLIEQYRKGIAK